MSRYVKRLMMDDLRRTLEGVDEFLFVDLERLNANEATELRLALRERSIRVRVVKNTLARIVLQELGVEGVDSLLQGPTAIAWGGDSIVELAREITEWTKKIDRFRIKGGVLARKAISEADVVALSKMPTREELIGRVLSLLVGSGTRVVSLRQGAGGRVLGPIKSKAEEQEAS